VPPSHLAEGLINLGGILIDGDYACWTGGIHALLGEKEQALAWLRRAVDLGNHNYPWFQKGKNYDRLRGDPEYQRIMKEVRQRWETVQTGVWCVVTSGSLENHPSRRDWVPRSALGTCGVVTPRPCSLLAPPNAYKGHPLSLQLPPSLRAQSQDVGRHLRLPVPRAGRVSSLTPLGRRRRAAR